MVKSSNKQNRLYGYSQPMGEELTNDIELGKITEKDDFKERAKLLTDDYQWEKNDALKIWSFGPENNGANIIVDTT